MQTITQGAEVKPLVKGIGWQTAMSRKNLSAPMKEILTIAGNIKGKRCLDFGCGRGQDADILRWEKYDPNWGPVEIPQGHFDYITCIYVLNVLPPEEWDGVINTIRTLLAPGGKAYIAVRGDITEQTATQWPVYLENCRRLVRDLKNKYRIYEV